MGAGVGLAAFVVLTIVWNVQERRRQQNMAARRKPLSESNFISQMVAAGVREDTAKFIWDEAAPYYMKPLRPDPHDYWETTMRIDPEDLEDITATFWKLQGWAEPSRKDPVILPEDPTLQEYALWLDRWRQFQE